MASINPLQTNNIRTNSLVGLINSEIKNDTLLDFLSFRKRFYPAIVSMTSEKVASIDPYNLSMPRVYDDEKKEQLRQYLIEPSITELELIVNPDISEEVERGNYPVYMIFNTGNHVTAIILCKHNLYSFGFGTMTNTASRKVYKIFGANASSLFHNQLRINSPDAPYIVLNSGQPTHKSKLVDAGYFKMSNIKTLEKYFNLVPDTSTIAYVHQKGSTVLRHGKNIRQYDGYYEFRVTNRYSFFSSARSVRQTHKCVNCASALSDIFPSLECTCCIGVARPNSCKSTRNKNYVSEIAEYIDINLDNFEFDKVPNTKIFDSLRGGTKKWVQKAEKSIRRRGELGRKAAAAGMTTGAYACKVLRDPASDTLTRRQAQFYVNINKSHRC